MELSFGDMEVSFPFIQNIQLGDMMAKRIIWCLIAVTLVMALHGREGKAEENICISPTTTSGVTIPPDWHGDLAIYAEKWTISRGEGVSLWCVCGEGPLCPEYQWSVSGNGFHFDSTAGPTTGETQKQFEIIQLWADGLACGTATITVTDDCGVSETSYIRCGTGVWQSCRAGTCIWGDCGCADNPHCCGAIVENNHYKYYLRWKTVDPDEAELCSDPDIAWLVANDPYGLSADGGCEYFCSVKDKFSPYHPSARWYAEDESVIITRCEWICP
jgi:hypothetical protein